VCESLPPVVLQVIDAEAVSPVVMRAVAMKVTFCSFPEWRMTNLGETLIAAGPSVGSG
jgi:hypothetical protein